MTRIPAQARAVGAALTLLLSLSAAVAAAAGGPPAFPVPGLSGGGLSVAGMERLADGGAVAAVTVGSGVSARAQAVRLRLDGTPALAFGAAGIADLPGSGHWATALAVNPAGGEAWIGYGTRQGTGGVLALSAAGRPGRGFGSARRGVALDSAPVALAWWRGRVLVAAGRRPCRGCALTVLAAGSGRLLARMTVSPQAGRPPGSPPGACPIRRITGERFTAPDTALVATAVSGRGCGARLLTLRLSGRPEVSDATVPDPAVPAVSLAMFRGSLCVAGSTPASTRLDAVTVTGAARRRATAPRGSVIAAVALGAGACAELVRGAKGGEVVQAGARGGPPRVELLPRSLLPLGMFRCHAHLIVLAARREGRVQAGVVMAVPVRRGPLEPAGEGVAATMAGTGCR